MSLSPKFLQAEADALGCPMATVAFVSGVSHTRLSAFLNGRLSSLNGDSDKVEKVLHAIRDVKESMPNVPIDFGSSASVKALLESQEERQGRAVFMIKQVLRELGLSRKDGFAAEKIAALQYRHPLSQYTIEKILLHGQGSDEQVQVLADLVAQLKDLHDIYAQSGGLDFEHEDLKEIRWQLARMYQSDPAPSQRFTPGVRT